MLGGANNELDVAAVLAAYERRVVAACPSELPRAMRSASALLPPNWTLEWNLPLWLAGPLGIDDVLAFELVVGNVLGLVSIRLQDDLWDGEISSRDRNAAATLAAALYADALRVYRARLSRTSPFWGYVDECMAEWRRGSASREFRAAARGAPLRIPAFGMCLISGRTERWPVLERLLEHAATAFVLYDQFCDWEQDLSAGRWNAFVAAATCRARPGPSRERDRAATLVAMMTGRAISTFFERIGAEARSAAVLAHAAGCPPLAAHMTEFGRRAHGQSEAIEAHYQGATSRAAQAIFGRRAAPA